MLHHDLHPDGDQGHWAVARSSDEERMLVQIGEIHEARQARLLIDVGTALHLAGDLLRAADGADGPGSLFIGEDDSTWSVTRLSGVTSLTLRDAARNADPEAVVAMTADQLRDMAAEIVKVAHRLLQARDREED